MVSFANNGLDEDFSNDGGLGDITGFAQDMGIFKSPSLRNVELTAPYMHDGRFEDLDAVIDFYSDSLKTNGTSAFEVGIVETPLETGFDFSEAEKAAMKAFLLTLTDESFITDPRFSNPFPQVVNTSLVELEGVSVYPNPTAEQLNIELPEGEQASIYLTAADGTTVFEDHIDSRDYTVYRNNLPNGIYFLRVEANDKIKTMKVIFE